MKKIITSYIDYNTSNTFYLKFFFNYIMILIALLGFTIPTLYLALADFYPEIIILFTIYKFQRDIFFLALDFYIYVINI